MCSVYAVCKVAHTEIKFKTIVAMYRTLLHAGHHIDRVSVHHVYTHGIHVWCISCVYRGCAAYVYVGVQHVCISVHHIHSVNIVCT